MRGGGGGADARGPLVRLLANNKKARCESEGVLRVRTLFMASAVPNDLTTPQEQQPLHPDTAALERLHALEHAVQFIASDTAQLLGGLQAGLQSVRRDAPLLFPCHHG